MKMIKHKIKPAWFCALALFSTSVQSSLDQNEIRLRDNVHSYLSTYKDIITSARNNNLHMVGTGTAEDMANDMGVEFTIQLIDAVLAGELDECCWRPDPATLPEGDFPYYQGKDANATFLKNDNATSVDAFQIPLQHGDPSGVMHTSNGYTFNAKVARNKLYEIRNNFDNLYDATVRQVAKDLIKDYVSHSSETYSTGDPSIYSNIKWIMLYKVIGDGKEYTLPDTFKDNYSYACVLCYGAGFYDTEGLHQIDPSTNKTYLRNLMDNTNHITQAVKNWWLTQPKAKATSGSQTYPEPPVSASIGFSLQTTTLDEDYNTTYFYNHVNRNGGGPTDTIYPPHCHQASELYFALHGISDQDAHNTNHHEDHTRSYLLDQPAHNGWWQKDMQSYLANPGYLGFNQSDVTYLKSYQTHSMWPARYFQFNVWGRFTRPEEGTYFPFHGERANTSQPPGGTCTNTVHPHDEL